VKLGHGGKEQDSQIPLQYCRGQPLLQMEQLYDFPDVQVSVYCLQQILIFKISKKLLLLWRQMLALEAVRTMRLAVYGGISSNHISSENSGLFFQPGAFHFRTCEE
jgi:hypothetical protein